MSLFFYLKNQDYDKRVADKKKGVSWRCYSLTTMQHLKEQGVCQASPILFDYCINKEEVGENYIIQEFETRHITKLHHRKSFVYKVVGFVECNSDDYEGTYFVRLIERVLPRNLLCTIMLALILIAGVTWFIIKNKDTNALRFDQAAIAYKMPDGTKNTDPNKISVPVYNDMQMKAGTSEVYAALINPEGNTCDFKYVITLADSQDVLYESDLIKPAMAITTLKLNRTLDVGEHKIKIYVKAYSSDDNHTELNGSVIESKMIVR